jgi:hypothetical protein
MVLSWSATADLETGLREFVIYRDGEKLGTLAGAKGKGNPDGHFQVWNYGDEPEPRPAAMVFTDTTGTARSRYSVAAVNRAGLESGKTDAK